MGFWLRKLNQLLGALRAGGWKGVPPMEVSTDYSLLSREAAEYGRFNGWYDHGVTECQDAAYSALIEEMYAGQPRQDLIAAANAVRCTEIADPLILEVGCGSGYYSEILSYLLDHPVRYIGLDYSPAMLQFALKRYPQYPFVLGDAIALPFADGTLDIVMNGVSLMHIVHYEAAIAEARRVAQNWCIFHTVPILRDGKTTFLQKRAYGETAVEVIFNEVELHQLLEQRGLLVRHVLESVPYDLKGVVGEPTVSKTYVCEVREG
jgi:ubiquinone/menaquinone biosynthesis C-methylase UbiE